jgi:hypothetical protein
MRLSTPDTQECADYTDYASFEDYVAARGCDWDRFVCCLSADTSCGFECVGKDEPPFLVLGVALLGMLLMCYVLWPCMRYVLNR